MDRDALREFIQDRFLDYDPTADISDGGNVDTELIEPILEYLGASPFDEKAYEFVLERLRQFNPDDLIDEGDALTDMAAKPLAHIIEPLVVELNRINNHQSFRRSDLMSREAAQSLGANFFVEMEDGTYTTGTARLYFSTSVSQTVNSANPLLTVNGDVFVPIYPQSISQSDMFLNRSGSFFYWDILVRSATPGSVEVERGEISEIQGLDAAVRVTNLTKFSTGVSRETVSDFIARARESLTERSLVTARGANARIVELFASARAVEVAGYNDIEMGRDTMDWRVSGDRARISATNPISFPLNLSAGVSDRIIVETDDGAGGTVGPHTLTIAGSYADIRSLIDAINQAWTGVGGQGTIASSWGSNKVMLHSWSDVPNGTYTHLDSKLKLVTPALRSAWTVLGFQASQLDFQILGTSGLVFSSMPGGILRPNTLFGAFTPETEKSFHIGGATDVYVRPTRSDENETSLPDVEDELPAWMGTKLTANPVLLTSDRVKDESSVAVDARPGRPDFTTPLTVSALDLNYSGSETFDNDVLQNAQIEPGDVVTIRSGNYGGSYMVAATANQDSTLDTNDFRVSQLLSSFGTESDISYHLSVATRINLTAPKRRMKITSVHGTRLQCFGASNTVSWQGTSLSKIDTNNFARYQVEKGDKVEILHQISGAVSENADTYTIVSITGSTLVLDRQMVATEVVTFQVYEETGSPVDLPLVRIRDVNMLDSLGAATGDTVPYALPVLVQSNGMSGARTVMEAANGIIDSATPAQLDIPSSYRSFTEVGVKPGMVVTLKHSTVFGTGVPQTFAIVETVADYTLTFKYAVPVGSGLSADDVVYTIGERAKGTARMYFQEPVSFEVQHAPLLQSFDPSDTIVLETSTTPFQLGVRDSDGNVTRHFVPRSKGILGGKRIYPALNVGEDPEVTNVDLDDMPSFAQDGTFVWTNNLASVTGQVDFTEFVSRQYGPIPGDSGQAEMGDVMLLYPERMLGFGEATTYTSDLVAERDWYIRKLFSVAQIPINEPNYLQIPFDSFNPLLPYTAAGLTDDPLSSNSVEGAYGQLEGGLVTIHEPPDGNTSPNVGSFRVDDIPVHSSGFSRRIGLKRPGQIEPFSLRATDDLVEECGRASYDQLIITVAAGAGDYLEGEFVTNGSISLTVDYWDPGTNQIYAYGDYRQSALPGAGSWTGSLSATTRTHSAYSTVLYMVPNDGTQNITFTGGSAAPGWVNSSNPGPWQVGRFLYLYGIFTAAPSIAECEGADDAMGVWKITAVNATGTQITVENTVDSTKQFVAPANNVNMGWVLSEKPRPLEHFGVYESFPTTFPISAVLYEDGGSVQEGRLEFYDPQQLFLDYTDGRAYSGVLCPYQLTRPGRVRLGANQMAGNEQDNLYYMDVQVESLGPEEENNLDLEVDMHIESSPDPVRGAWRGLNDTYRGEGYVFEVKDPNMSYSLLEEVKIASCPRILPTGQEDLEPNKVILDSRSLSVAYDHSDLVANVDAVLNSDSERVTSASLLARHFTPAFVRLLISYSGSGLANDIITDIKDWVDNLTGSDRLEVSDIEGLVHKRGADFIDQNFALVALFHDQDRSIIGERSRNFIGGDENRTAVRRTTNRVSHFISDEIELNKL